jgi:hypothetical protein
MEDAQKLSNAAEQDTQESFDQALLLSLGWVESCYHTAKQ